MWGYAAYLYRVLAILSSYQEKQLSFSIDGREITRKVLLLTVANGTTFGGGFKLTPQALPDDGLLEICLIEKIAPFRRFLHIGKLGAGKHGSIKEVHFFKGKEIKIAATEKNEGKQWMHIDGELMGQPPFDIKIVPQALKVRVRTS